MDGLNHRSSLLPNRRALRIWLHNFWSELDDWTILDDFRLESLPLSNIQIMKFGLSTEPPRKSCVSDTSSSVIWKRGYTVLPIFHVSYRYVPFKLSADGSEWISNTAALQQSYVPPRATTSVVYLGRRDRAFANSDFNGVEHTLQFSSGKRISAVFFHVFKNWCSWEKFDFPPPSRKILDTLLDKLRAEHGKHSEASCTPHPFHVIRTELLQVVQVRQLVWQQVFRVNLRRLLILDPAT